MNIYKISYYASTCDSIVVAPNETEALAFHPNDVKDVLFLGTLEAEGGISAALNKWLPLTRPDRVL